MAVVLRAALGWLATMADHFWNYCDPRTQHLPLVNSPVSMVGIVALYLYFVLSLGPQLMKKRKAFELRAVMQVYNAVQVVWCAYLIRQAFRLGWNGTYSFACEPLGSGMEPSDYEVAWTVWLYMILKIVDLFDTVIMVLRKKSRQISFLHVYHHTGMVFCTWLASKAFPGGHHTFLGYINCYVHCVLYAYYFLVLYSPSIKLAWWKKYITVVQIAQFGAIMVHEAIPLFLPDCGVHKLVSGLLFMQNFFMFVLFVDFYLKTYSARGAAGAVKQKEKKSEKEFLYNVKKNF